MRIRFKKGDPRAGQVVNVEEGVARAAIDRGEAEEVTGKTAETDGDRRNAESGLGTRTGTSDPNADRDLAAAKTGTTARTTAAPAPAAPAPAPAKTAAKTTRASRR